MSTSVKRRGVNTEKQEEGWDYLQRLGNEPGICIPLLKSQDCGIRFNHPLEIRMRINFSSCQMELSGAGLKRPLRSANAYLSVLAWSTGVRYNLRNGKHDRLTIHLYRLEALGPSSSSGGCGAGSDSGETKRPARGD
jgi:hypothetical protein